MRSRIIDDHLSKDARFDALQAAHPPAKQYGHTDSSWRSQQLENMWNCRRSKALIKSPTEPIHITSLCIRTPNGTEMTTTATSQTLSMQLAVAYVLRLIHITSSLTYISSRHTPQIGQLSRRIQYRQRFGRSRLYQAIALFSRMQLGLYLERSRT